MDAQAAYEEIVGRGGRASDAMRAFRTFLGHSDMMAYLAMMAPAPDRTPSPAQQPSRRLSS
jgi:hypothetical protein